MGETGTGKELVARAVHDLSGRSKGSFVKVNCAAIPASLLESELFGHEKGSFTGAVAQKIGRFELAHGGTLFLDEIGEMPLELQPKLLRAIQDQEFERVGGNRTIRTDARLVAATNRDLKAMVEENKFRADLYYRLHVFPLHVPPLRDRREDIPLLTRYFVQKHAQRMGRNIDTIPTSVLDALTNYHWPGNIRELQNVLERSVILTNGSVLQVPMTELTGKTIPITVERKLVGGTAQRRTGEDPEGAGGSQGASRRSGRRCGSTGTEANDLAIPHAQIQHLTRVSLSKTEPEFSTRKFGALEVCPLEDFTRKALRERKGGNVMSRIELLDPNKKGREAEALETRLRQLVIGQDDAISKIVEAYQGFRTGMSPAGRPVGNFLFLGPTGSGKTRVVEATAEALLNRPWRPGQN